VPLVIVAWAVARLLFAAAALDGRFRNARHALVSRHLRSGLSAIARRYVSRSLRRDSVSSGEAVVDLNQDFEGREAGGGLEARDLNVESRLVNSE
jgi:hypothetical protein